MPQQPLKGVFVPNIVPYDSQGRINEEELRRIIHWLGTKGVTGFYPNGSMGEFIRLTQEERKRVLKIVVEEAGGRPILAGAAEANIDEVLKMCAYCADLGCRAVSLTGPYYYKLTQESIEAYYREIAAKSPIDIVIYNIPAFANEITVPVLTRLAMDCPRIVGTKDTSRDMPRFQMVLHTIKRQRPDFSVLIGWEELFCTSLFMGGDGATLSSGGVVPELVMRLYQEAVAGNWEVAKRLQFQLLDVFSPMVNSPNFPEGFRAGYELRGFQAGPARFPLSDRERAGMETMKTHLATVLAQLGIATPAPEISPLPSPTLPQSLSPSAIEAIVREVVTRLA